MNENKTKQKQHKKTNNKKHFKKQKNEKQTRNNNTTHKRQTATHNWTAAKINEHINKTKQQTAHGNKNTRKQQQR